MIHMWHDSQYNPSAQKFWFSSKCLKHVLLDIFEMPQSCVTSRSSVLYVTWLAILKIWGNRARIVTHESYENMIHDSYEETERDLSHMNHVLHDYFYLLVFVHIFPKSYTPPSNVQHRDMTHEHVKYEVVMSESCHVWMRHVTYELVLFHMTEVCHIWMSPVTHEWVMSHMNESCHIWMSHVTYDHMTEVCHIWMSDLTYEWVVSLETQQQVDRK